MPHSFMSEFSHELDRFIDRVNHSNQAERGAWMYSGGSGDGIKFYFSREMIPDGIHMHYLNLHELRALPQILIDAILKPDIEEVPLTGDLVSYWAWTTPVVDYYLKYGSNVSFSPENILQDPDMSGLTPLVRDYAISVELVLLSVADACLGIRPETNPTSVLSRIRHKAFRTAALGCFPVLEGLLCRICDEISIDGYIDIAPSASAIEVPGRRGGRMGDGCSVNLCEELYIWKDHNATEEVRLVLEKINNMRRYVGSSGSSTVLGVQLNDLRYNGNLFSLIYQQRNHNLHGEGRTRAVAAIVLTLISLLLWTQISQTEFRRYVESFVSPQDYIDTAPYYPFFPDEAEDLSQLRQSLLFGNTNAAQ